jgi:hypothetical protein
MRTWKQCGGALAFGALLVGGLLAGPGVSTAAADAAGPAQTQLRGAPGAVAVVTVVRARDLMSAADRQLYRQQLRQAREPEARLRVQAEWLERLQARAAEHGVIMVIQARPAPVEPRRVGTAATTTAAPATATPGPAVVRPAEPVAPPPPPRAP